MLHPNPPGVILRRACCAATVLAAWMRAGGKIGGPCVGGRTCSTGEETDGQWGGETRLPADTPCDMGDTCLLYRQPSCPEPLIKITFVRV